LTDATGMARCDRRTATGLALALVLLAGVPARGGGRRDPRQQARTLTALARARFGTLSAGERTLLRGAPFPELAWIGPDSDPDSPANDPAHAEDWGPERSVRAVLLRWLYADPDATRFLDPSGLGLAGARVVGPLDLSYVKADKPLTIVGCYVPDGIDLRFAHLQSLDVRGSVTGAIAADRSELAGDLAVRSSTSGALGLFRAHVGGNVDCTGSTVRAGGQAAVNAVASTIAGDVIFHEGFTADGTVDVRLARVGQSLSFNHAAFVGAGETGLDAERASIGGTLYWVDVGHTPTTRLDLENARADALWDDEASWPVSGKLAIDGFTYGEIAGGPGDAESRLRWLARRDVDQAPQPYAQLAKILHESGRETDATDVLIAREEMLRRDARMGRAERLWNLMLEATIGYGYRPLRALWWIAAFVVLGTLLFGVGYRTGIVMPTDEAAYRAFVSSRAAPPHYPPFHAFVYALETFMPVVELDQGAYWRPNPRHGAGRRSSRLLRWYLWLHVLAGWTLTPLFFAGISGLVRPG
jgi:hypothetical protein